MTFTECEKCGEQVVAACYSPNGRRHPLLGVCNCNWREWLTLAVTKLYEAQEQIELIRDTEPDRSGGEE